MGNCPLIFCLAQDLEKIYFDAKGAFLFKKLVFFVENVRFYCNFNIQMQESDYIEVLDDTLTLNVPFFGGILITRYFSLFY